MKEPTPPPPPPSTEPSLIRSTSRAEPWLKRLGLPHTDALPLRPSPRSFADGSTYGLEIPGINSLRALEAITSRLRELDVYCTRFNETYGSFLLGDRELQEMFALCAERGYGLTVGLGPRPEYDIKAAFARSEQGLEMGRRLNNNDAFACAIEEALRLVELGCTGLLVYDLGVLRALHELRQQGAIPSYVCFKTSSHCMVSHPLLARIAADNGADSITTAHDLGLPVLQEIRRLCPHVVLDVPVDTYAAKGGFMRFHEVPELVQIAAPMFLKVGGSTQASSYAAEQAGPQLLAKVERARLALERAERALGPGRRLGVDQEIACVPRPTPR